MVLVVALYVVVVERIGAYRMPVATHHIVPFAERYASVSL